MKANLSMQREALAAFYQKHGTRRFAIFGSALRDDLGPESDIELLVEFDPEHIPTLFDIASMEQELSYMLGGQKVDLRTPEDLSRYFRDQVLAEAKVQYAAE